MSDEDRGIFDRAKELVEQGWCQKDTFVKEGGIERRCVVGAICDAVDEIEFCGQMRVTMVKKVCKHLGLRPSVVALGHWNDAPGRTQAEVVALLEAVAAEGSGQ